MKLSVSDLYKRYTKGPYSGKIRLVKFIEKFKSGDPFELNDGKKVKLSFDNEKYKLLINASKYPSQYQKELQKAQFLASEGKQYYKITDLKKTLEFDGKPDRPPAGIEGETKTVNRINIMIQNIMKKYNYKNGVPILVKGKKVYVTECMKVPGTPKADLAMLDKDKKEVIWISYKMGTSVKDFQQWGGISDPIMQSFPQVQDFIQKMNQRFPKGMKSGQNAAMHIKGDKSTLVKNKAVYGYDFKPGAPMGRNNVSFVVQGRIDLRAVGSAYTIISTNAHAYENGTRLKSSEDPIFFAKYTGDRGQYGVKNSRMTISPYAGSNVKEWLD